MALMWAINRNNGQLWSCDIEDAPQVLPYASFIDLSRRKTIIETRAADLGKSWTHGLVDLVYLDASHSYKDTCEEIDAWMPHIKEGGLLVFHDTEIYKKDIMRAIFDRMMNNEKLFELHHFPDCHGHAVLQWYSGEQTSTKMMRETQSASVVSLTALLANAK